MSLHDSRELHPPLILPVVPPDVQDPRSLSQGRTADVLSISEAVYSFVTVGDQVTLNNATVTNLNPGLTNLLMTSVEIHVFVAAAGSGANFEYANRLLPRPLGTANNPLSDWRIVGPFKHNVMTEIAGSSITLEFTEYGSEDKEVLILRNESGVPKDVTFVSRVKYIVNRG